jgi:hypothetical protein
MGFHSPVRGGIFVETIHGNHIPKLRQERNILTISLSCLWPILKEYVTPDGVQIFIYPGATKMPRLTALKPRCIPAFLVHVSPTFNHIRNLWRP